MHQLLLVLTATLSLPGTETEADKKVADEVVTWSGDVARIVQQNCEVCHRPGQAGPFSLQSYDQAKNWSSMIELVVSEERMPPWNADEKYRGVFANERALPKRDKNLLLKWIETGMARGNPQEDPEPIQWPTGWGIGEPDVILTVDTIVDRRGENPRPLPEKGFEVPTEGVVEYEYFKVATDFGEDRWIQACEVRPGAADVVHHVLILVNDPSQKNSTWNRTVLDFRSYLAAAVPGDVSNTYPPGYAKRLPAGAELIFQLHYTPNGKKRFDRTSVGLIFADETPELEVITTAVTPQGLRIPPNDPNYEMRAEYSVFEDTAIVSFLPHMHTRGKDFRYIAHYPDGTSEELLSVSNYDFNWQESYTLPDPLPLPPDTVLEIVGHYDNSAANPNNPDPDSWVYWGDQTFEEMFIGYFDYVTPVE